MFFARKNKIQESKEEKSIELPEFNDGFFLESEIKDKEKKLEEQLTHDGKKILKG